jgi:hypothetical protein
MSCPMWWQRDCGHRETRDMSGDERLTSHLKGLCDECKNKRIGEVIEFARYGKPHSSGCSWNHRDKISEPGISVYEIVKGRIEHVGWYFGFEESRPLYTGKGRIVGWGSDGEPLVEIISIQKANI